MAGADNVAGWVESFVKAIGAALREGLELVPSDRIA
jgi:hypothetical protein